MTPAQNEPVDLAIIGAGPTGLYAAFYAGLRRMTVKLIDSLEILGGQLTTLYPEKFIYDVPGFPRVLAKDLANNLIQQGLQYGATPCLGEQVRALVFDEASRLFTIHTSHADHAARSILIAAGVGAFQPKTLPLPNAKDYAGRGVHYFVQHLDDFRGQRVLIVGGGDSAVDWANTLAGITASQTLIHRRDVFRAHEDSVTKMMAGPTDVMVFRELRAIGGDGRIQWAVVYDNRSNIEQRLEIDAIVVNIGFSNSLGPIKHWGLEIVGGSIKVDSTMLTSRPGVFAAGDVTTYPGKLKLIATGFGEAATAVNHAKQFIDPGAKLFPGHSTEMKR
ncbi:MAG TPA: NAD(P)/FAD-dependent oxidoreductase [Planctomycetaceae bacterium]|nr:NAD(P)/FAD-dependent oxidoreductase [Planctomycetaceae bacterium]